MSANNEATSKVQVALRVRPRNRQEIAAGDGDAVMAHPETSSVVLDGKQYTFHSVFPQDSTQDDVFRGLNISSMVDSALEGYNATVIAYGQTGSGKTYTMGSNFSTSQEERSRGLIPRIFADTLQKAEEFCAKPENKGVHYVFKVSFVEIYNKTVRDLLVPGGGNIDQLLPDEYGNVNPVGVCEESVNSLEELSHFLEVGASRRTTSSTRMNEASSRSHAILTLKITREPIDEEGAEKKGQEDDDDVAARTVRTTSLFRLVDLAGSERASRTGAEGIQFTEACNINSSLSVFGKVVKALADGSPHVAYRESKLTHLLSNSLGGNSKTILVVTVSSADSSLHETKNTIM